jgi:phosphopantothenoylcysteine synthetase/decarboxylase
MSDEKALFLYVSGAGSNVRIPDLMRELVALDYTLYTVLTPNVSLVTPPAPLMDVPGNHWVHEYRQDPLDRFPFGTQLVAPCTFNTFNKIALGLADNLATSMIADALGAGCRVIIAPSFNKGLWSHPQTKLSLARFAEWGVEIVPPTITEQRVVMAPQEEILAHLGKS